jgi:hypothetical protein
VIMVARTAAQMKSVITVMMMITMCWSVLPLFHFVSMSHALAVH